MGGAQQAVQHTKPHSGLSSAQQQTERERGLRVLRLASCIVQLRIDQHSHQLGTGALPPAHLLMTMAL